MSAVGLIVAALVVGSVFIRPLLARKDDAFEWIVLGFMWMIFIAAITALSVDHGVGAALGVLVSVVSTTGATIVELLKRVPENKTETQSAAQEAPSSAKSAAAEPPEELSAAALLGIPIKKKRPTSTSPRKAVDDDNWPTL